MVQVHSSRRKAEDVNTEGSGTGSSAKSAESADDPDSDLADLVELALDTGGVS
jgi:hypothetical protein